MISDSIIDNICECEMEPFDDYLLDSEEDLMHDCCVVTLRDARRKDCLNMKENKITNNDKCSEFAESYERCFNIANQNKLSVAVVIAVVAIMNYRCY